MDVLDPAFYFESSVVEWKHDAPTEAQGMKCHPQTELNQSINVNNTCITIYTNLHAGIYDKLHGHKHACSLPDTVQKGLLFSRLSKKLSEVQNTLESALPTVPAILKGAVCT